MFVKMTLRTRQAVHGYFFILPWLIGFLMFVAGPFLQSLQISFTTVDMMAGFKLKPVGFANYIEAFTIDERFVPTLLRTFQNTLIDTPLILVFSLFVAFLVNQKLRFTLVYKAVFFLPVVIASGLVVQQLFNQGATSMTNSENVIRTLDIPNLVATMIPNPKVAQILLDVLNRLTILLWRSGIQILLFLAGLQGIAPTYYEASRVDGATDWEVFWKITLPMLSPIILVNLIYTIVDSFTDVFNPMLDLIKNAAFTGQFRLGYAAALGWVYFLLIFVLIALIVATSKKWVFYSGEREG